MDCKREGIGSKRNDRKMNKKIMNKRREREREEGKEREREKEDNNRHTSNGEHQKR